MSLVLDIKPTTEKQFDEIWPILESVIRAGESYPYPIDMTKEDARASWCNPLRRLYTAYADGKPVATRYISPNQLGRGDHVANTGSMVHPKYRGKGIGKQLMEFALNEAKKLGFKAIQLNYVVSTNEPSIHICKSFGFNVIGTIPKGFRHSQKGDVDVYIMHKELGG